MPQDPARIQQHRDTAASFMADAIEQLTDRTVREHAVAWHGAWALGHEDGTVPPVEELVDRVDAALKSLLGAKAELIEVAYQEGRRAGEVPA